jgi:hypothetical protein
MLYVRNQTNAVHQRENTIRLKVRSSTQPSQDGKLTQDQQLANRLARISRDMDEVVDYLDAHVELSSLQEGMTPQLRAAAIHACMSAAIVSYSRGFVRSHSKGFADSLVQLEQFKIVQEAWAEELHERIVQMRKQAVAHADWEHHATCLVDRPDRTSAVRVSTIPNIYQNIQLERFRELAQRIGTEALNQRFDLDRGAPWTDPSD